jgi:hypothetical protein
LVKVERSEAISASDGKNDSTDTLLRTQKGLEFFATVATTRQVLLDGPHGLIRLFARQGHLGKAVQVLEAIVASDLVGEGAGYSAH